MRCLHLWQVKTVDANLRRHQLVQQCAEEVGQGLKRTLVLAEL